MPPPPAQDAFLNALRRALQHLYDPAELRRSPLYSLLGLPAGGDRVGGLRNTLQGAILALKPNRQAPDDSNEARIYEILTYRYIEQSSQKQVAADMALSIRQLQRLEAMALEALGASLAERHALAPEQLAGLGEAEALPEAGESGSPEDRAARQMIDQELAWLEHSSHFEAIDAQALIGDILSTLSPLIESLAAAVQVDFPERAPLSILGDPIILRQTFLTLLSALIHACPGGSVGIRGGAEGERVWVEIRAFFENPDPGEGLRPGDPAAGAALAPLSEAGPPAQSWLEKENELFQKLIGVSAGELSIDRLSGAGFIASLRLPGLSRRSVLALDDNADALALLDRYLSGSRYGFTGLRDPGIFFTTAHELEPNVVILDVMLPGIDGWQILGRLKTDPKTRPLPVLVSTILPQETLALMLGAAAFLRKPFTQKELLAALDQLAQAEP